MVAADSAGDYSERSDVDPPQFPSLFGAPLFTRLARSAPAMKITKVETVYWKSRDDAPFWPHWT
jgi:hypothetical protein